MGGLPDPVEVPPAEPGRSWIDGSAVHPAGGRWTQANRPPPAGRVPAGREQSFHDSRSGPVLNLEIEERQEAAQALLDSLDD